MIYPIDEMKPNNTATLMCDSAADIADLPAYAKGLHLAPGSQCLVKTTGVVYAMASDGSWGAIGGGA